MKKIIIALVALAFVFLILPLVGNKVAEETLNDRVELLTSYGVELMDKKSDSSYFKSKKHYKFVVSDEKKFIKYLSQFSDAQLPPYTSALVKGVVVGVDIEYSNLPISDALSVDIYPLSLSSEMMDGVKREDEKFYNYIKKFFESKGILYHINYNIVKNDFDGYIKDIDEKYMTDDKTEINIELEKATFKGKGPLIAPIEIVSNIEKINISANGKKIEALLTLKGFSSTATFNSESTYITTAKFKNLKTNFKERNKEYSLYLSNLAIDISANSQDKKAQLYAKTSLGKLVLESKGESVSIDDFNYDFSMSDLDKDDIEAIRTLVSQSRTDNSYKLQKKIQNRIMSLLSKGMKIEIADLSLKNFILNKTKKYEGFKVKSTFILKPDNNFAKKLEKSPMLLLENIDLAINFVISKPIFKFLEKQAPALSMAKGYAKEVSNNVVYDITMKKGKLRVNGKEI